MNLLDKARIQRAIIVKAMQSLADKDASTAPEFFGTMNYGGALIAAGTRINWNSTLKRAAVDLWDRETNNPDNAPTLWEDIDYREGYRIIPETITAGLAFAKGEIGWWKGTKYKSLLGANVYTPDAYPAGWEKIA